MTAERVLCIAAHPDDEVLLAGGALAKHARAGDAVRIFIVAEGATSRGAEADATEALREAARQAAQALGAGDVAFGGLADQRLDEMALLDVTQMIEREVEAFKPTVIYTHHGGDLNLDHRVVHQAVLTAARPVPGSSVREMYAGETPSSTEWSTPSTTSVFVPTRFVDIAQDLDAKMAALECYAAEMRPFPHARSLEACRALAELRGSQSGAEAAEAFVTLRKIKS